MNLTLHSEWPANWRTYFLQLCFDSSTRIRQFLSWVKKQRFRIFFLSSIIFPLFCLPFFYLTLLRSDNIRRQPPRPPMRLISQEVLQMDTLCPTVYISQPRSVADVWEVRAYCSSIKGKGKVMPLHCRCDPEGGYRYSSTLTWPRYYKGVSGQQYAPAALHPREKHGTHFTGGWVGPRGRSGWPENLVPTGIRSRTVQPVAQSVYRLRYPAQAVALLSD